MDFYRFSSNSDPIMIQALYLVSFSLKQSPSVFSIFHDIDLFEGTRPKTM